MFSVLMIARLRRALPVLVLAVPLALAGASCQKVPLLAPSGSTITLTASATTLPVNGTTALVAQVVEAAGTVPHSGTRVTFTTNLGTIQPDAANTDTNGQARVTFNAGTASGTATITATSGGVGGTTTTTTGTTTSSSSSNTVKIAIGAAAVGRVGVTASPATVPAVGGDSTITANVLDTNGSPLASVAVSFSTTAGSLSSALVNTDANGVATAVLHTATQAVVTASVGAAAGGGGTGTGTGGSTSGTSSGTVTVGINGAPTLVITPPASPTAGLPASFTFAVTAAATNGTAIRDVTVAWGDGDTQDLGAVTGSAVVAHTYGSPDSYTVTGKVTDASGNTVSVSTAVVVLPQSPIVGITFTSNLVLPNNTFTFTAVVTPAGTQIALYQWDFGDGTQTTTTTPQTTKIYTAGSGTKTVRLTVTTPTGQTGRATITVTP